MIKVCCDFCKKSVKITETDKGYIHVTIDTPNKWGIAALDICNECADKLLTNYHAA